MSKLIDCGNYYNEKSFKELCAELEKGQAVEVYIDSIGHTRNNNEQETYKEELLKKYQSNLMIEKTNGAYSYNYSYRLKCFASGGENA